MNREKVAKELVEIAKLTIPPRSMKADVGDVPVYFNVMDYIERSDNNKLNSKDINAAKDILENVVNGLQRDFDKMVSRELKKTLGLGKAGLTLRD